VQRCTFFDLSSVGVDESAGTMDVAETIALKSGRADFLVVRGRRERGLSSDRTGTVGLILQNPAAIVESTDPTAPDLHLKTGSRAIDAGQSVVGSTVLELDVDGQRRPIGSGPDIGADEHQPLP
jgi:hypothetical protein